MENASEKALVPAEPNEIKKALGLKDPTQLMVSPATAGEDVETKAKEFAQNLLSRDPQDLGQKKEARQSVETMASELQKKASTECELLKQPIRTLAKRGEDGGEVANALIQLKMEVEKLDPSKVDFAPGWFSRTLGKLPGIGSPLKKYFTQYESGQTIIAAIMQSLEKGRDMLGRDNITLTEDQKKLGETAKKLEKAIQLGQLIDQKIQYALDREIEPGSDRQKYVTEEVLFPLRQRIIDLQQQLAVSQQGVMAIELIIRNNVELIRGVNRAMQVTMSALQVAVTVAMALENQKIVLDKLDAVNKTTSNLISGTAKMLRTQGAEIQQRASNAMLDMNSLKTAFAEINQAMEDIASFRTKALPQMASTVLELDQLNQTAKKSIEKMESSKAAAPALKIELD